MKVKNLNPFERHVEKITVGVAALGACALLYQGIMVPTTITYQAKEPIPGSKVEKTTAKELGPDQVEREVTAAVDDLKKKAEQNAVLDKKTLFKDAREYVPEYLRIHDKPLAPVLLTSAVPPFAPRQMPVKPGVDIGNTTQPSNIVVTPTVPPLQNGVITADRGLVLMPLPPVSGAPAGAAPVMMPQDLNWVVLSGEYPVVDFRLSMNNAGAGKAADVVAIPAGAASIQRVTFHKIQVQRRVKVSGGWSEWADVAPTKAAPLELPNIDLTVVADANIPQALDQLDKDWKNRIFPSFYANAGTGKPFGPPALKPMTPEKKAENAAKLAELAKAMKTGAPGEVDTVLGSGAPELAAVRSQATIPVWFYDENVEPERTYQYKWRISMFNPVYKISKFFGLKQEALRNQPWIASEWTAIPGDAQIKPNISFFMMAPPGNKDPREASAQIFRWNQGSWYVFDETVYPGMAVGAERKTMNVLVDFTTHYTLVDVVREQNDTKVVLLSPLGELITRSVNADSRSEARNELQSQLQKLPPPPPVKGTTVPPKGGVKPPAGVIE